MLYLAIPRWLCGSCSTEFTGSMHNQNFDPGFFTYYAPDDILSLSQYFVVYFRSRVLRPVLFAY